LPRIVGSLARAAGAGGAVPGRGGCGMGLVELMTGMAVGMLIVAAMAALFANSSAARSEIDRTSQQIENGRFALQVLRDDIHSAGYFYGYIDGARQIAEVCIPRSGVPLNTAALGWQTLPPQTPLPIHGYAAGDTPAAESCISNQKANTDVLILRRVESAAIAVASAADASNANDYFMQISACADAAIDAPDRPFVVAPGGSTATAAFALHQKDCATPAPVRKLVVRAYYIGKCSVCTGGGDGIPALRMVELAGASASSLSVVEGIESMRIEYALDTDDNGQIDTLKRCKIGVDACSPGDWRQVIGVRVHLLARNLTPSPGYTDTKTYDMGLAGTLAAPNDRYKRHLYSAMVIAFNLAGVRER
jgi:type IV pilus assembly protein PilW